MPKIAHIAIYCLDIEKMRAFYETYFEAVSNGYGVILPYTGVYFQLYDDFFIDEWAFHATR